MVTVVQYRALGNNAHEVVRSAECPDLESAWRTAEAWAGCDPTNRDGLWVDVDDPDTD